MWKCLHDDPDTSKLLKQIHGASLRPEITYPKVRTIPRANLPPAAATDGSPKNSARRGKEVRVPRFRGSKTADPARIDSAIMRRKREAQIQHEQAVNRDRLDHYRPPYIKPIGEEEKLRLAEKFEFGGGKALPLEMTGPVMPIPSEALRKNSERKRIDAVIRRRRGTFDIDPAVDDDNDGCGRGGRGGKSTTMFDQVADEIEERQQFLLEARASDVPYEHEARITAEISQRMRELERLTPT